MNKPLLILAAILASLMAWPMVHMYSTHGWEKMPYPTFTAVGMWTLCAVILGFALTAIFWHKLNPIPIKHHN
jgi:hypothetical protein